MGNTLGQPQAGKATTHITRRHKLFYGLGAIALGVKENGLQLFLMIYYAQVRGLSEAWVGLALLIALFVDAVGDPIIGHVSDRLRTRWGRRHPLIYAGAVPAAIAYFFLWAPPDGLDQVQLFVYLMTLLVLVRSLISLCEIPGAALTPEMTTRYRERTQLMSYRFLFGWGGGLSMGLLTFSYFLGARSGGILQAEGYRTYGLFAALVIAGSALLSAWGTHDLIPQLRPAHVRNAPKASPPPRLRDMPRLFRSTGTRTLLIATIIGMIASGLGTGLDMYFSLYFWRLATAQMAWFPVAFLVSVVVSFWVTPQVAARWGKRKAAQRAIATSTLIGLAPLVLALLGWFPSRDHVLFMPLLVGSAAAAVACRVALGILFVSMLSDQVEAIEVETGVRSEGTILAVGSLAGKAMSGVGLYLAGGLLHLLHFPAHAVVGQVDAQILRHLAMVQVGVSSGLAMASVWVLERYETGQDSHERNLSLLLRRKGSALVSG